MLGRAIFARLSARNDVELTGTAFSRARSPMLKADLTDADEVEALFAATKPDFVIHAAAERRPDIVDKAPETAKALNVAATETIAAACARYGAFLLYISTDYVFDGANPPYFPDSTVNPLNEYGRLKLEGERRIFSALADAQPDGRAGSAAKARGATRAHSTAAACGKPRAAILRIPLLYGPVERLEECSVTELSIVLKKGAGCTVEHWAKRYPLHVDDVAAAIERIIDAAASRPDGLAAALSLSGLPIFLLSGPVAYTKYEMLMVMAKVLGIDASYARPNEEPPKGAPRPKDCRMDTALIESLGYEARVDFEAGIAGALAPFFGN